MPRFSIPVNPRFQAKYRPANHPDRFGRRVRDVSGVNHVEETSRLLDPLFVKIVAGLAIVATIAITGALWRLLTFPR